MHLYIEYVFGVNVHLLFTHDSPSQVKAILSENMRKDPNMILDRSVDSMECSSKDFGGVAVVSLNFSVDLL